MAKDGDFITRNLRSTHCIIAVTRGCNSAIHPTGPDSFRVNLFVNILDLLIVRVVPNA